ncbi:MAG: hypothetical protein Q8930_10585 [Bacillota bacterium]|nr:hypothetical protein [Bacillota bacterium]
MRNIKDKSFLVLVLSMAILTLNMQIARADMVPDPKPPLEGVPVVIIIALIVIACIFASIYILRKIKNKSDKKDA